MSPNDMLLGMSGAGPTLGIQRITVFQIGDVHFDDFANSRVDVDQHDNRPPAGLTAGMALRLPKLLADSLHRQLMANPEAAIVFCGDFTSKGNVSQFREAIRYISDFFSDVAGTNYSSSNVHVVPGNHDVDRYGTMKYLDLGLTRFHELADIVDTSKIPAPLTLDIRVTEVDQGNAQALICSLNSCRASGAYRQAEELKVNDPAVSAISRELGLDPAIVADKLRSALINNIKLPHEALDIPLIHGDDLVSLVAAVEGTKAEYSLPIVVAHHGFLPQGTPRLNSYTEMINGGEVRQTLANLKRPVLYLHGHIHEDTVEVIRAGGDSKPLSDQHPLVVISAPLFKDGFNEIVIEFTQAGKPLGLSIIRHRLRKGVVSQALPERISLSNRSLVDEAYRYLVGRLNQSRMATGSEILGWAREPKTPVATKKLSNSEVEECIETLCWQGLLASDPRGRIPFVDREYTFR